MHTAGGCLQNERARSHRDEEAGSNEESKEWKTQGERASTPGRHCAGALNVMLQLTRSLRLSALSSNVGAGAEAAPAQA